MEALEVVGLAATIFVSAAVFICGSVFAMRVWDAAKAIMVVQKDINAMRLEMEVDLCRISGHVFWLRNHIEEKEKVEDE